MKGLFIPEITAEMFRNGCFESIEALMAEGEIYDIEYSPRIPVSERLPENLEQGPIDKSAMMYEIYMAGVNMSGEYTGCWVRFKEIEKIVDKYMRDEKPVKIRKEEANAEG